MSFNYIVFIYKIIQMKIEFEGWKPLENPNHGTEIMKEWKDILEDHQGHQYGQGEGSMGPYERLIWEIWMSHIRKTVM